MVLGALLIVLTSAMLTATFLVTWRSRPAAVAARRRRRRQHEWTLNLDANLKRIAHLHRSKLPSPTLAWREKDGRTFTPNLSSRQATLDHHSAPAQPPRAVPRLTFAPHVSQLAASTLSVLLLPTSTMPLPLDRAEGEKDRLKDGLALKKPQPIATPGRPISTASAYWFT